MLGWLDSDPEGITSGQDTIVGTLIPPSFKLPFTVFSEFKKGPALLKKSISTCLIWVGPLSLEKIIRVFSYFPISLSFFTNSPTCWSKYYIIAA